MIRRTTTRTNTRGWWGMLTACLTGTSAALVLAAGLAWLIIGPGSGGGTAAASLGLAGAAVVILSGATLLLTAWSWDRWREQAIFIALFGFVVKIVLMGLVLVVVPPPAWLDRTAAGIGALAAIVTWQVIEVLVFARTRQQIYDD
ncbi:hypothetical protein ABDK96_02905 [Citricoccus nitrophenolicus]|uniref:ATP synthase protein I n=1 Tax=Citricoccus nitrophenolicus TaxID=863575 RepID=A0ABV0IGI6_9MICC